MHIIKAYLENVRQFHSLIMELHGALNNSVHIKSVEAYGVRFIPTKKILSDQLKSWPQDMPKWPPAMWVDKRNGTINVRGEEWNYAFHGQGVSFSNPHDGCKVSVEYTMNGELGITSDNVKIIY
jgi:hypothetical protein